MCVISLYVTKLAMGSTVSVDLKEEINGTVRWTGIVISDEKTGSNATMDWLEASPLSDDEVKIVLGPKITIVGDDPTGEMPPINFDMDLVNNQVIMSEAGDLVNAAYSGERMSLKSVSNDPDLPLTLNMMVEDLVADYALDGEALFDGSASSGDLTLSYSVEDDGISLSSDTSISSMEVSFDADLPKDGDGSGYVTGEDNAAVSYSFKDIVSNIKFSGDEGDGWINSSIGLSAGSFSAESGAFALNGEAQDLVYQGQLPLPGFPELSASMESAMMNMSMTAGKPGEVAPMAIAMTLEELVVGDAIWGMFDPTGAIPREPATLRFDLGAEALWMSDDIESSMTSGQPPFMPQSMALRELFLTVGGASISATGDGILSQQTGQPSGAATVELKGVLTLITTLSEIGLVPVPQAMMAQGMLPQFTRPGPDGSDHLISDIEAMPDGSILVNGTRIK